MILLTEKEVEESMITSFTMSEMTTIYTKAQSAAHMAHPWYGDLSVLDSSRDYSFAILSDRTGMAVHGKFEQALELVKRLQPEFVISVGDLVEGYCLHTEEAHEQWNYIDNIVEDVGLPVLQTVGNHDYSNDVMSTVWRERKGYEYYAVRRGGSLFLFLTTEDEINTLSEETIAMVQEVTRIGTADAERADELLKQYFEEKQIHFSDEWLMQEKVTDEQLDFFAEVLSQNADAEWTYVIMHQPLWKAQSRSIYTRLTEMLGERKATLISGHIHYLETQEINGRQHIQMGRTGGGFIREGKGNIHHILWVEVKNSIPSFQVMLLDGTIVEEDFSRD